MTEDLGSRVMAQISVRLGAEPDSPEASPVPWHKASGLL